MPPNQSSQTEWETRFNRANRQPYYRAILALAMVAVTLLAAFAGAAFMNSSTLPQSTYQDSTGVEAKLHSLGKAPSADFALSFKVRVTGGKTWHSVGAYYGKSGGDYRYAYLSAASPQTKTQIAERVGGVDLFPGERSLAGAWKLNAWYAVELRVRAPLANLLVDGKLCCAGPATNEDFKDVGLFLFDAKAEFKDISLSALKPDEKVIPTFVHGPSLDAFRTKPASSWGAYFDKVAAFAASDVGIENARKDPVMGAVPPYVFHAVIDPNNHFSYDGAYPAFHHSLFIRAFLNCYRYYGDAKWLARAKQLADWNLLHSSPPDCLYPNLPYSTVWEGKMGGFQDRDGLMLDKVGWTGLAYLRVWGSTGEAKYLDAAKKIAETLLRVQNPDGSWDFRVRLSNPVPTQKYTGNQVFNVQFLERLAKLTAEKRYSDSAARAWAWLEANPLKTGHWEAFYEDVDPKAGSIGNWDPIEAGLELVKRGQIKRAEQMADWVRAKYGVARNARGIGIFEQTVFMVPMNCHTMHWCELVLALYKATGKKEYRDAVVSAVNLCTSNVWKDGRSPTDMFVDGPDGCWYSLSFSPLYLGLELMADLPDHAPKGENHILSSTADVRNVRIVQPSRSGSGSVSYETAAESTEHIKLAKKPARVTCDGKTLRVNWDGKLGLQTVRHPKGKVSLSF